MHQKFYISVMNKREITLIALYSLISCYISEIRAQNADCPGYFPCQSHTLIYQTLKSGESGIELEQERIELSPSGGQIDYNRTLSVISFSGGGQISFSHTGSIQHNGNSHLFGPDYFLPKPNPSFSDFIEPPVVVYTGPNCPLPNTISMNSVLPACSEMAIKVTKETKSSGNPFLAGGFEFNFNITYSSRIVLAVDQALQHNGQTYNCIVIKEKRASTGVMSAEFWEVSWLAKGIGKVKSHFFKADPGNNWNNGGSAEFTRNLL
jgi:hypothetical protein